MHNGNAPRGIASASFKTGKHSKYLPERMIARYDEARADREFLALQEDIALIDSRISDVLQRVDTGDCGENWKALGMAVREFNEFERKAKNTINPQKQAEWTAERDERMRMICVLVEAGLSDYKNWQELGCWLEKRRVTVESEQKRLVAMKELATSDQVAQLFGGIARAVHIYVTDPDEKSNLSREMDKLARHFLNVDGEIAE
jgi:hypothetical protein